MMDEQDRITKVGKIIITIIIITKGRRCWTPGGGEWAAGGSQDLQRDAPRSTPGSRRYHQVQRSRARHIVVLLFRAAVGILRGGRGGRGGWGLVRKPPGDTRQADLVS